MKNGIRFAIIPRAAAAFACVGGFPTYANAQNGTFVTFDVPGCSRDISPIGINPAAILEKVDVQADSIVVSGKADMDGQV
jgi:hypothetical protein